MQNRTTQYSWSRLINYRYQRKIWCIGIPEVPDKTGLNHTQDPTTHINISIKQSPQAQLQAPLFHVQLQ